MSEAKGVYKMGSIAELSGFSPTLLRAWEMRHGLLEPERRPSGHRLYTDDDLQVLRRIRDLLGEGRAISELAALGRDALLEDSPPVPRRNGAAVPLSESDLAALVDETVAAARGMDGSRIGGALDQAFSRVSPAHAIEHVIVPAARTIGELWSRGELSVAAEHLATGLFVQRLHKLLDAIGRGGTRGEVLCACLPEETHELGALVVAFHASQLGYSVSYLGADLPIVDLDRACQELAPKALLLSVTNGAHLVKCKEELLRFVTTWSDRIRIVVGGAGVGEHIEALEAAGAVNGSSEPVVAEQLEGALGRR